MIRFILFAILFCTTHSFSATHNSQQVYLSEFLNLFKENPRIAMNLLPPKYNSKNEPLVIQNHFSTEMKLKVRQKWFSAIQPQAGMNSDNQLGSFFKQNTSLLTRLDQLKSNPESTIENQPWSGDYWATYRGGIGARYADPQYPHSENYLDYDRAYKNYEPLDYKNQEFLDALSPSEKYDILVGDESFSLTKWTFASSKLTYDSENKKIATWYGICHGWAPASFMEDRPTADFEIQIENFKGQNFILRFYPDDIKALVSLFWANTSYRTYYIGSRCSEKDPKLDENGRLKTESCFDINPGTWHQAIINQLAIQKNSFVMDARYDYEVWNHPIASYTLNYFNPETHVDSKDPEEVTIETTAYTSDHFKKYRNPNTKSIVGVSMDVTYVVETEASHMTPNSSDEDIVMTVQYIYDLELNSQGEIIGGEWYQNAHPDFIWTPAPQVKPMNFQDYLVVGTWDDKSKQTPLLWKVQALTGSVRGQPLRKVIEGLIEKSNTTH